jgi:hypothetical protein
MISSGERSRSVDCRVHALSTGSGESNRSVTLRVVALLTGSTGIYSCRVVVRLIGGSGDGSRCLYRRVIAFRRTSSEVSSHSKSSGSCSAVEGESG